MICRGLWQPSERQTRIVDAVMVTIMEHGLVPSAVVTRLTHYGAPESFQGAVAAGLLGVGDRYAGTAGECGAVLERIVDESVIRREAVRLDGGEVDGSAVDQAFSELAGALGQGDDLEVLLEEAMIPRSSSVACTRAAPAPSE